MKKSRLDSELLRRNLVSTRSQATSFIRMGKVYVNGQQAHKPGIPVKTDTRIELKEKERYVSRAAYKLASVAELFQLDFIDKTFLDVGSSTGGFTDYALRHGAKRVIAVDVGTEQLHPSLRRDQRIDVHEKTDIRDFAKEYSGPTPDIIAIDVSFISQRKLFSALKKLAGKDTYIISMAKPQFEGRRNQLRGGVVKNERTRRDILRDFEIELKQHFLLQNKADSDVAGSKGNTERFYLLKLLA